MNHPFTAKQVETFWSRVDSSGEEDACWAFRGRTFKGYKFCPLGRRRYWVLAHRMSYMLAHGHVDGTTIIRHDCDNPSCCNPAHLRAGTHRDNMEDMARRGRASRGEQRPNAKLTNEGVLRIFELRSYGRKYREIADAMDIDESIVSDVINRKRWRHVAIPDDIMLVVERASTRKYTRLSDAEVEAIRREYATGTISCPRLAREYGSAVSHIRSIVRGEKRRQVIAVAG